MLLVVVQQVVPQWLLGERLGVAHNDHTIPSDIRQLMRGRLQLTQITQCEMLCAQNRVNLVCVHIA